MAVVKNKATAGDREFWSHVESVAQEVSKWPKWMRGNEALCDDDSDAAKNEENPDLAKAS
jgi:hypothetical protein